MWQPSTGLGTVDHGLPLSSLSCRSFSTARRLSFFKAVSASKKVLSLLLPYAVGQAPLSVLLRLAPG